MRKFLFILFLGILIINLSLISAVDIVYDNFEDGSLSEWGLSHLGTAANWVTVTTNPYQGSYHAQSRPTYTTEPASVMQRTISTSGYENIVFSYYKRNIGLDTADEFQAEWYDGTGWALIESTGSSSSNDAAYVSRSYSLPSSASNNPNFAIKFECTAGATSEYCRVDNLNISGTSISCEENLQNSSWNSWISLGGCMINDLQQQIRNKTQYDTNNCGYVNQTFYEYQNISCNYCSYNNINTTKSSWYDIIICNASDNKIQTRNWTEYDANYNVCYAITGLVLDLFTNRTWYENQTASCDYCVPSLLNTTKSDWTNLSCSNQQRNQSRNWTQYDSLNCVPDNIVNMTYFEYQLVQDYQNISWSNWQNLSCLVTNLMNQTRNLTQYDVYGCALNQTFYEYRQTESCDFCTPDLVNTTKTEWQNQENCRINDTQLQNRSWIQYDANNCGEIENITYWEYQSIGCDYCTPNNVNSSWSGWYFTEECQTDDLRNRQRNRTEYDSNNCYAVTGLFSDLFVNLTYSENEQTACDYCVPSLLNTTKSDWYFIEDCQIDNTRDRQRNWTQYDVNSCNEIVNQTYSENEQTACDYCIPLVVNTTWTGWNNYDSCLINDLQQQNRSKIEYDSNNCYELTGLAGDEFNNNTYWEWQNISCDFCIPDKINTSWSSWNYIESCQIDDIREKQQNLTEYDQNDCYKMTGLISDIFNNITYFNNSFDNCDYCSYNLVNSSWSDWTDLACFGNQMNQSRNNIQYDSNYLNCYALTGLPSDYYANQTFFEYQSIGPDYINTSWSEWQNISCLLTNFMNQSRNLIQYDNYGCALNQTFFEYKQTESCDYCTPDLQNTTKSDWQNQENCRINDTQLQNRSWIQYDANNCGEILNITYSEYQTVGCNYCSYDLVNSSWSNWENISCLISDLMNQSRFKIESDLNYNLCYAVTGLASDLWNFGNNKTYVEYRDAEYCDYCSLNLVNTTWNEWANFGSCLVNNTQVQIRNLTQYDLNNCGEIANETIFDYQILACDYCTPNLLNTTKSDWSNLVCSNEQMNQSRNWTQYDINNCNEVINKTFFEYQLVGPIYINTSWSNWQDSSECDTENTQVQIRSLIQYDTYRCSLNQTFFEYREVDCDFCTPYLQNTSWSEWVNEGVCLINDIQQQVRDRTEYDVNDCGEIENISHFEYQNISCDYCTSSLINTTKSDWYYLEGCDIDDLREKQRNWTQYDPNNCDEIENTTYYENSFDSCDFLIVNCEVGGPYQQGALVLFIGNVSNYTGKLVNENVNISLYKNDYLNLSNLIPTSEDGDFETIFSGLGVGSYRINANVSYFGANEICTDSFEIGNPAYLILDKTVNIQNLSNNEIFYNISLRVLNSGGSDCINLSLSDSNYGDYNLENLAQGESVFINYLMNFTRQNLTYYYLLNNAEVSGIDSYSNSLINANSSPINLIIPANSYSPGKQVVIIKNIVYNQETNLNVSYNLSAIVYNTGDEDLENINYVDSDLGSSILLNLSRESFKEFSNLIVLDKAASNVEHEFALGSITLGNDVFYSNRPRINIPGYGGPADLYVYAPISVTSGSSFNSLIEVLNMNFDIGQDFVIDYWITNNDESVNYSSGQKTVYISAMGDVNTSIILTSPLDAGDYRLKALVSWTGGIASAYDSFEVIFEQIVIPPSEGGGEDSGGGGGTIIIPENKTGEVIIPERIDREKEEIVCNSPYIRHGESCCLDRNHNQMCDIDEPKKGITGLFVREDEEMGPNYPLFLLALLLFIVLFILYKLIRRLLIIKKTRKIGLLKIKDLINLEAYSGDGIRIGRVIDVILGKNNIEKIKIRFIRKISKKLKRKGILLDYRHVQNIGEIVIIDERISEVI